MAKNSNNSKAAAIKPKDFFKGFIGQTAVISEMNEVLTLEEKGIPLELRSRFLKGLAGLGKTEVAKMIADARASIHGAEHRFIFVAPGTTRPQMIKKLAENAAGRPATIFIDEAHDLDKRLANMLKPILETGGKIEDVPLSDECIFPSNPFQHLWLFASNENCKDSALFGPTSRTTPLHFVAYTDEEKGKLIKLALTSGEVPVSIDADAIAYLVERVWPNARSIMREMCPALRQKALIHGAKVDLKFAKAFCAGELFNVTPEMRKTVARYPKGLQWIDVKTLQFLANEVKGKQVAEIGHFCDGEKSADTSYRLQWLSALGLTTTLANGRKALAKDGAEYLDRMQKAIERAQAAKKGAATRATAKAAEAATDATQENKGEGEAAA